MYYHTFSVQPSWNIKYDSKHKLALGIKLQQVIIGGGYYKESDKFYSSIENHYTNKVGETILSPQLELQMGKFTYFTTGVNILLSSEYDIHDMPQGQVGIKFIFPVYLKKTKNKSYYILLEE